MRAHTLAIAALLVLTAVAFVPAATAAPGGCDGVVVGSKFTGVCLQGCSGPNGPGTAIYVNGVYSGCIY
ncbi:MAG: hypothetical protein QOG31_504 [Thermoplasmata archaeon]|jgi:hypothetical protein|nr:hypothetical protein [Thermoplasmata archaeon]